jgi:pyruvate dehydrogenase E1 component
LRGQYATTIEYDNKDERECQHPPAQHHRGIGMSQAIVNNVTIPGRENDPDPAETAEWLEGLRYVLDSKGPERVSYLLSVLEEEAYRQGVEIPFSANTPYINTIPADKQPVYPGNRDIERRLKSIIRWNAMAMVVRANRHNEGIGGHISTYASAANLYEVAFNHFFRGRGDNYSGDQVYFQGHASPGIYARAYLEGRLTAEQLENFRQELTGVVNVCRRTESIQSDGDGKASAAGAEQNTFRSTTSGLSSYPHPWLMPGFWEFPTVSMGLAPIMAIYQARFNKYLMDRGIKDTSKQHVWAFLGDGECDEPESLGAITLASREQLDNLIFVVNCNLQRLDGPVRGNGKIIQELEAIFRGAGWNVIKVIWGDDWDPLLAADKQGILVRRMGEVVDGEYQKYVVSDGDYIRQHFFGKYPETLEMVSRLSDEKLQRLRRGGHDPEKVFAAYQAAIASKQPTVILAKTIKGYGLGEAGEGRNITHQQKKLNEEELREFRTRFGIPINDDDVAKAPFYKPPDDSPEMKYLRDRRAKLGGYLPSRPTTPVRTEVPKLDEYLDDSTLTGSEGKEWSTTQGFVRIFSKLLRDKRIGKLLVPIVPDESRTFGMEGLFRQIGIYAHAGQLYEPVDSHLLTYYKEAKDGQLLEEGITEAGSMCSFIAAGTAYATHGINMMPFYIYYSMFGFQRIGDLIWAACDNRAKGFLLGATAGRTTLAGEGLQHQDGHSLLMASAYPTVRSYDPAFAYETTVIIFDGLRRMYEDCEDAIYYLTLTNEPYEQPALPAGAAEGIVRGMYKFSAAESVGRVANPSEGEAKKSGDAKESKDKADKSNVTSHDKREPASLKDMPRVQLFGSGAILRQALDAQRLLAEQFGVASDVWSVTSYSQLRREALECERWNMLHPDQPPRRSHVEHMLEGVEGPFIAASDYVRSVPELIERWVPGGLFPLGTDGFGRSDTRDRLRRFFEVDAQSIAVAALHQLAQRGKFDPARAAQAIGELAMNPDKVNPMTA